MSSALFETNAMPITFGIGPDDVSSGTGGKGER
jgi:hypothetical protein